MGVGLADDSSSSSGAKNVGVKSRLASGPVDMMRKAIIYALRNRKSISVAAYAFVLCALGVLVYDPSYLDVIFPFLAVDAASRDVGGDGGDDASAAQRLFIDGVGRSTARPINIRKLYDLPFVPRDFHCDEMHMKVRGKLQRKSRRHGFIA